MFTKSLIKIACCLTLLYYNVMMYKGHLVGEPQLHLLRALFLLYIWALVLLRAPWVVAIADFVLGNSMPKTQRWAELLSLEAQDSDLSACQSSHGQAASSGIAALSPALFTLVTLQHLKPTPGMFHRQCGSQGKWPVGLSQETNTVYVATHLH